jgi:hypothetical protein
MDLFKENIQTSLISSTEIIFQVVERVRCDESRLIHCAGEPPPHLSNAVRIKAHDGSIGWRLSIFVEIVVERVFGTRLRHDHEWVAKAELDGLFEESADRQLQTRRLLHTSQLSTVTAL